MPYRCLADFLEDLGHAGELTRVEEEVDPALEAAEIAAREAKSGGPALLFGAVKGHDLPVLCNLLGTEGRICRALGVAALDEVADRIARLFDTTASEGWFERLKGGAQPAAVGSFTPRKVKSAACQQIVRLGSDIDLGELPLLQVASDEGGPSDHRAPWWFRPSPIRIDPWPAGSTSSGSIARGWRSAGPPTTSTPGCWASTAGGSKRCRWRWSSAAIRRFCWRPRRRLPPGSDVCAVAGLLREKSLDVVACRSVDLDVPAEAEIVLEGFVDPTQPPVVAGPLCGPTGHLTQPRPAPVMQVTAVTHRANPIYAVMVPGRPPHEAVTVARAMQRVFLPLARLAMPELVDYDLPEFAAARHWAAVSIRKTYPGQGRRAAHAAWGLPAMMFAKMLVIVDEDVDVHDQQQVLAAVATNVRPGRDVMIEHGPADPFDPAAPVGALGEKMALDATRKLPEE